MIGIKKPQKIPLMGIDLRNSVKAIILQNSGKSFIADYLDIANNISELKIFPSKTQLSVSLPEDAILVKTLYFPEYLPEKEIISLLQTQAKKYFPQFTSDIVFHHRCIHKYQQQQIWSIAVTLSSRLQTLKQQCAPFQEKITQIDTEGEAALRCLYYLQQELPSQFGLFIAQEDCCQGYAVQGNHICFRQTIAHQDLLQACQQLYAMMQWQLPDFAPQEWILTGSHASPGLLSKLADCCEKPLKIFNPLEKIYIPDTMTNVSLVQGASFTIACGLALKEAML